MGTYTFEDNAQRLLQDLWHAAAALGEKSAKLESELQDRDHHDASLSGKIHELCLALGIAEGQLSTRLAALGTWEERADNNTNHLEEVKQAVQKLNVERDQQQQTVLKLNVERDQQQQAVQKLNVERDQQQQAVQKLNVERDQLKSTCTAQQAAAEAKGWDLEHNVMVLQSTLNNSVQNINHLESQLHEARFASPPVMDLPVGQFVHTGLEGPPRPGLEAFAGPLESLQVNLTSRKYQTNTT